MANSRYYMNDNQLPAVMTLTELAVYVRVTPETAKRRCADGTYPAFKDGKGWRIKKEDLLSYIEHQKKGVV